MPPAQEAGAKKMGSVRTLEDYEVEGGINHELKSITDRLQNLKLKNSALYQSDAPTRSSAARENASSQVANEGKKKVKPRYSAEMGIDSLNLILDYVNEVAPKNKGEVSTTSENIPAPSLKSKLPAHSMRDSFPPASPLTGKLASSNKRDSLGKKSLLYSTASTYSSILDNLKSPRQYMDSRVHQATPLEFPQPISLEPAAVGKPQSPVCVDQLQPEAAVNLQPNEALKSGESASEASKPYEIKNTRFNETAKGRYAGLRRISNDEVIVGQQVDRQLPTPESGASLVNMCEPVDYGGFEGSKAADQQIEQLKNKLSRDYSAWLKQEIQRVNDDWEERFKEERLNFKAEREALIAERDRFQISEGVAFDSMKEQERKSRDIKSDFYEMEERHKADQSKLNLQAREISYLEGNIHKLEHEANALKRSCQETEALLQVERDLTLRLRGDTENVRSASSQLENRARHLEDSLASLEDSKRVLENNFLQTEEQLKDLGTRHEVTNHLYRQLQTTCNYLEEDLKQHTKEIKELKEEKSSLLVSQSELKRQVDDLQRKENSLMSEKVALQQKADLVDSLRANISHLRSELEKSKVLTEELKSQAHILSTENNQLQERQNKNKLEIQTLNNNLLEAQREAHQLKKDAKLLSSSESPFYSSGGGNRAEIPSGGFPNMTSVNHPLSSLSYLTKEKKDLRAVGLASDTLGNEGIHRASEGIWNDGEHRHTAKATHATGSFGNIGFSVGTEETHNQEESTSGVSTPRAAGISTPRNPNLNFLTSGDFYPSTLPDIDHASSDYKSLEQQLTLLNLEKGALEAQLAKYPYKSLGRSVAEKRLKENLDRDLERVDKYIGHVRQILRKQRGGFGK